jgi:signal transduction histidine kinase/DNA-binding response OmpR family regulator
LSTPTDLATVNVLLVDDQPGRLMSYEAILEGLGFNMIKAQSGTEALRLLMQDEYAVILLDVNMPGMDGFETATLIHQHPRYEKTPIIFVTAVNISDLDRLRGYKLGAVDYIYVPVVPEILRSKVSALVELYCKRRELQLLNRELESANEELAAANRLLHAEATRELQQLNQHLERSNAELAQANRALENEIGERRRAEERLHVALNTGRLGALEIEITGGERRLRLTDQAKANFGCEPGGTLSLDDFWTGLHDQDREYVRLAFERALAGDAELDVEYRFGWPDRNWHWLITRGRIAAAGDGPRFIGVTLDITERKLMEEALRESDRRKDEFLAILGHELRNPLAPIRSAIEIMATKQLADPELTRSREVLQRQTGHLTRLVDDLLDVSRITRGKIELRRAAVSVADIVARAIEANRALIDTRAQMLQVSLPDPDVYVDGDPTRLAQVIGNLLNNASKYTPEGGRIDVSAQSLTDRLRLTVRDSGLGIPQHMLGRIFEPFTQVEEVRDRAQGGLGIGLALVRRLVDMHGGHVEAASEGSGRGSAFTLELPLHAGPASARADDTAPEVVAPQGSPLRVLIADDNDDAASMLTLLLEFAGHEVSVAHDGQEAIELARTFRPDVAFLDIGMPRVNGFDAARRIRADSGDHRVVLIALTGWGQPEDRRRTMEAGFDEHRVKPVDCDDLLRMLSRVSAESAAAGRA